MALFLLSRAAVVFGFGGKPRHFLAPFPRPQSPACGSGTEARIVCWGSWALLLRGDPDLLESSRIWFLLPSIPCVLGVAGGLAWVFLRRRGYVIVFVRFHECFGVFILLSLGSAGCAARGDRYFWGCYLAGRSIVFVSQVGTKNKFAVCHSLYFFCTKKESSEDRLAGRV